MTLVTLAYMDGWTDVRTFVRTDVRRRHGYKTTICRIDGLPYFLNYGAPRARLWRAWSSAIREWLVFCLHVDFVFSKSGFESQCVLLIQKECYFGHYHLIPLIGDSTVRTHSQYCGTLTPITSLKG